MLSEPRRPGSVPSSTTVQKLRGDAFADAAGERGRPAAVEVALQSVADRFVQQHAGPARAEHHRHRARGRRHGFEVDRRLAHGLARQPQRPLPGDELLERIAAAGAGVALFAAPVLLHDDGYVHAHERPNVGGQRAVARGDQDDLVHGGERRHHLPHPRVQRARATVELLQQRHLVHVGQCRDRVVGRVQAVRRRRVPGLDLALAALARDRARRARRLEQRRRHDLVGIGEARALAGHRPHAHALLDAVAAFLDDAVLERPVLLPRQLEIQVARVDARAEHRIERLFEAPVVEAGGREDALTRALQGVAHPITRCFSAGKLSRVAFCPSMSSFAVTTWLPRGSRASTRPQ